MTTTPAKGYYHICSDGNCADVLFKNEDDFKAAMNRVAVCALRFNVLILAFVLMDNHFHFVILATEDNCIRFINEFKRLTGKYVADTYGEVSSLLRLPVKVIPVADDEYLKTLIAYVIKNPTKARLDMFYNYPWGSGCLLFRRSLREKDQAENGSEGRNVRRLWDLGVKEVRAICRTRASLPRGWLIKDGMILPENYVAVDEVERLFRTTRAYMHFLSRNADAEMEKPLEEWNVINLSDTELRAERKRLSRQHFGGKSLQEMSVPERLKMARLLRNKYLCSRKQLARIVQLSYEAICHNL